MGSVVFGRRSASYSLHFSQQITKLAVVNLYPIVEIQGNALVGVVAEVFVEAAKFVELFDELVLLLLETFLLCAGGRGLDVLIQIVDTGLHAGLEGDDVFHAHAGEGAGVVAVQVHEGLEGFVFAGAE